MLDDYLFSIAYRKYSLYKSLYVSAQSASTSEECYQRIIYKAQYEEVDNLINFLPLEKQTAVDKHFRRLKS